MVVQNFDCKIVMSQRSTRNQPQQSADAASDVSVASSSSQASGTGTNEHSRIRTPHLWEEYSFEDWEEFREKFRTYTVLSGKTPITKLLIPMVKSAVQETWEVMKDDSTDLCALNDSEFTKRVNELLSPHDKSDALDQLKKIEMAEMSFKAYCRFNANFKHAVDTFTAGAQSADELMVKTYINQLRLSTTLQKESP